jgi:hypothetical protein
MMATGSTAAFAQVGSPTDTRPSGRSYLSAGSVQPIFQPLVGALGPRLQSEGKEHLILAGTLSRNSTTSPVIVTKEFPNSFRIEESGGKNTLLVFDGQTLQGRSSIDAEDEDLAEMLGIDTSEHFLGQVLARGAIRSLGQRFRVEGDSGFGEEVNIFELSAAVPSRAAKTERVKHVMFDSRSHLLRRVAYTAWEKGSQPRVETVYSSYSLIDGHSIPTEIRRLENGKETIKLVIAGAELRPKTGDPFAKP